MAELDGVNLDLTLGVVLVGLAFTGCLFGVTTAQCGWYFKHYPRDRMILKSLVVAVWSLDATHLCLYFATIFTYLVKKTGSSFGVDALPWTSNVQLLCNACVMGLIQSFYASRIWTLSRHIVLLAVMIIFIFATWAFSTVLFVRTIFTHSVKDYILLSSYDIALSALGLATDVLLCGSLVWLLSRSRTGTEGADRLINKLLFYTLNTGLLTSVCATLSVITVALLPATSIFIIFYYIGSRLYTVSLLATLNARLSLRMQAERMGERTLPEIRVTTVHGLVRKPSARVSLSRRPDVAPPVPYSSLVANASVTTGNESASEVMPSGVVCEGGRCYVMPEMEFGFAPDFGGMLDSSCTGLDSRNAPER